MTDTVNYSNGNSRRGRGSTSSTLAILGLLAGFVNVDAFRPTPAVPCSVGRCFPASIANIQARGATVGVGRIRRDVSSAWRTASGGLSMSTLSATDDFPTTEERDSVNPARSVMDELDAILEDVQKVTLVVVMAMVDFVFQTNFLAVHPLMFRV